VGFSKGLTLSINSATDKANFSEDLKKIGMRIKARRKFLRLTQPVVSKRAEISFRYYQSIEAGKINFTISTIMKIAEVLQLPASQLISEPPEQAQNFLSGMATGGSGPFNFRC
jgi:transcriptional regulator with XRE-family HTH domain